MSRLKTNIERCFLKSSNYIDADIRRLAAIKIAMFHQGIKLATFSPECMEKIAWIDLKRNPSFLRTMGLHLKHFGKNVAGNIANEGRQVINGVKQIPRLAYHTVKNPKAVRSAFTRTVANTNWGNVAKNTIPDMAADHFATTYGIPIVQGLDALKFIGNIGSNLIV